MYKILALNCLISAYRCVRSRACDHVVLLIAHSLSVMYLDGIKFGDYQVRSFCLLRMSVLSRQRTGHDNRHAHERLLPHHLSSQSALLGGPMMCLIPDARAARRKALARATAFQHLQSLHPPLRSPAVRRAHRFDRLPHPSMQQHRAVRRSPLPAILAGLDSMAQPSGEGRPGEDL